MTDLVEICRICFQTSKTDQQHKWMDLDAFLPIIQLLAQTQVPPFNYYNMGLTGPIT